MTDLAQRLRGTGPLGILAFVVISALGPVLEVTVDSVEEAKLRLVKNGCKIVKDEPDFPRCYVKDPFGLIYNLTR